MKINGHEVEFRDKLPAPKLWDLMPKLRGIEKGTDIYAAFDWPTVVQMVDAMVESIDGEEPDPEELDIVFAQNLCGAMYSHFVDRFLASTQAQSESE